MGNTPEIVSKLPSRGKLTWTWGGGNMGGSGWVWVGEGGNFSGNFRQFLEKFPRIHREGFGIPNHFRKTDRSYWSLLKFNCVKVTNSLSRLHTGCTRNCWGNWHSMIGPQHYSTPGVKLQLLVVVVLESICWSGHRVVVMYVIFRTFPRYFFLLLFTLHSYLWFSNLISRHCVSLSESQYFIG